VYVLSIKIKSASLCSVYRPFVTPPPPPPPTTTTTTTTTAITLTATAAATTTTTATTTQIPLNSIVRIFFLFQDA
jgi:hypothetical protein